MEPNTESEAAQAAPSAEAKAPATERHRRPERKPEPPIRLVVGLGNPGQEYDRTRHNAGFHVVDRLAEKAGVSYWKNHLGAMVAQATLAGREVTLAKPQSFMNSSGGPVSKIAHELGLSPAEILVIHDELDIEEGDVRVKVGGGHGGHNGLRSIIDKLGSRDFIRVRVGIGRPPGRMDPVDFVLRQLKGEAGEEHDVTCAVAADAALSVLEAGPVAARDCFNGLHRHHTKGKDTLSYR